MAGKERGSSFIDIEFFHPVAQGIAGYAQLLCSPGLVPTALMQDRGDQLSFSGI